MTFEEWWKKHGIEQATYAEKSAARKGWEAGTKAEREACAVVAENFSTRDGYEIAHKIRSRSNQRNKEQPKH